MAQLVYVPDESVRVLQNKNDEASMIVLEGLDPITDEDIEVAVWGDPNYVPEGRMVSTERVPAPRKLDESKEWH